MGSCVPLTHRPLTLHPAKARISSSCAAAGADDQPDGEYPSSVLAAAVLAAEDVSFLLVGSAALGLHGECIPVGDADAVIEPGEQNIHRLRDVLAGLALRPQPVRPARDFSRLNIISVTTSYGQVDCLLERGRQDWQRLRQAAVTLPVADAGVLVAARADARALRRRFRQ
jgi:hypothetical protein